MKTSPKRLYSVIENERFGFVFAKTGSIISGTEMIKAQLQCIFYAYTYILQMNHLYTSVYPTTLFFLRTSIDTYMFERKLRSQLRSQLPRSIWLQQRQYDMNGRSQMQGGKKWKLPKEIIANRFFWDSHWLEIWKNHLCVSGLYEAAEWRGRGYGLRFL